MMLRLDRLAQLRRIDLTLAKRELHQLIDGPLRNGHPVDGRHGPGRW
jgi:hypothetical protein